MVNHFVQIVDAKMLNLTIDDIEQHANDIDKIVGKWTKDISNNTVSMEIISPHIRTKRLDDMLQRFIQTFQN